MGNKNRSFAIAFSSALIIILMATFCHGAWVKDYPDKDRPMEENLDYLQGNNNFLQDFIAKFTAVNKAGVWYDGWDNASAISDNGSLLGPFAKWDDSTALSTIPKREGALSYDTTNDELYSCNGTAWKQVASGSAPVAATIPVGTIFEYGGTTAPTGYLMADGTAVSRTTYADLFTVYGTTYGVGDGSTTFNLPDRRGRVAVGKDNMGGTSANRITATAADTLGGSGGAETHTLLDAEIPKHGHSASSANGGAHTHTFTSYPYVSAITSDSTAFASGAQPGLTSHTLGNFNYLTTTQAVAHAHSVTVYEQTTGDGSHNNLQPYIALNYIIKY